jgi:hypothetical protein
VDCIKDFAEKAHNLVIFRLYPYSSKLRAKTGRN